MNPFAILFGPALWRRTVLATLLAGSVQFGYWGLFFWLPSFLATPIDQGGAGMTILRSMSWIIPMQIGAYLGYFSFGFIADRLGRRRTFALFLCVAALLVPIYGQLARSPTVLLLLGPLLGFAGHGFFSVFGSFLGELFPTAARATGQGLAYNAGRGLGALAPFTIGAIATMPQFGIGTAHRPDVRVLPGRGGADVRAAGYQRQGAAGRSATRRAIVRAACGTAA